jgi:hypothetical protein
MSNLSKIALNLDLFSARSIFCALVPIRVTPFFAKSGVRLFAVCPPTDVTIPLEFSNSKISKTLSNVNSSKNNLLQIS